MSSIVFDASLNTDKLDKSIKESNRVVKEWAKNVETSSKKADQSFKNLGTSLKSTIANQKGYIKGMTLEIREMQKAFDKAVGGSKKSTLGAELSQAKRRLTQANKELVGMQQEQAGAQREQNVATEKAVTVGNKLMSIYGGLVVAVASVGKAFGVLKRAVLETETGLNRFNVVAAATKQLLYDILQRTSIKEWKKNMQEAISLQKSLNYLRVIEREDLEESKIYQISYMRFLAESKDQNKSVAERIQSYDYALKALNRSIDIESKNTATRLALVKEWLKIAPDSEKLLEEESKLTLKLLTIENRRWSRQQEVMSMKSGLEKSEADKELKLQNSIALMKLEIYEKGLFGLNANIKKELEAEKQKYDKELALAKGNEELKTLLAEEYSMRRLGIMKKETTAIANYIKEAYKGSGSAILKRALERSGSKDNTDYGNMGDLIPMNPAIIKKNETDQAQRNKDENDALQKQYNLERKIVGAASNFVYQLGEQVGLTEDEQDGLAGMLDTMNSLASGDYFGAITSLLSSAIAMFPSAAKDYADEIARINNLLDEQRRIIEKASRSGGEKEAWKQHIESLKKQKEVLEEGIEKTQKSQFWFGIGKKANKEFQEQFGEILQLIEDAEEEYQDFLSGGVTQNTIADVIAQGFQEGKTSVDDFADYMNDVLINAMLDVFKAKILGPELDNIAQYITDSMNTEALPWFMGGGIDETPGFLSDEEIQHISDMTADASDKYKEVWDNMFGGLDLGDESSNVGLTGAIRRDITEETGTELAGLFRRFADDQRVAKDYSILGVNHLVGIEANTFNTVIELQNANTKLDEVIINTKQTPVGDL